MDMKTARLFRNGRSQAVRLPHEFQLPGDRVWIKRDGNVLILIPMQDSWQALLNSLDEFSDDFMAEREQPRTQQEREGLAA